MRDMDILIPFRMVANNILDWGIGLRYTTFWNTVEEAEKRRKAASVTSEVSGPSKKRRKG